MTKDLGDIWTSIYQWQGTFTWEWERPRKACGWQNCGMGAAYSSPHHNSKQCTHCLKSHLPAELVKSLAACLTKGKCLYPLQLLFFHCLGRCFSTWPCQGATWGLCEDAHSNLVGRGGAYEILLLQQPPRWRSYCYSSDSTLSSKGRGFAPSAHLFSTS